jgi:FkbM family methyltransferase
MNRVPAPLAACFRAGSLAARLAAPALELGLPNGPVDITVRSGAAAGLRLPIDAQREKFYWTGTYEPEVQRALQRLLGPGDCFWDVGAHIGFFTALAAQRVGLKGRVYAFEPLPANRSRLARTIDLNELDQVEVLPNAVAGRGGRGWLHRHESSSMWSLVEADGVHGVEVRCVALDEVFLEGSLTAPTLVKIDAEGAELDVLRGGSRLAETSAAFIVEFTDSDVLAEARSLLPDHLFEALSDRHWCLQRSA